MDICSGLSQSSYDNTVQYIKTSCETVFKRSAKKAVEEEQKENEKRERPLNKLKVSGDGSWKRRGFKSMFGVVTLICYYTGKVVDFVVKSSFCKPCLAWKDKLNTPEYQEWYEEHEELCTKNHEGSAGAMEVAGVKEMFLRSEELGVKYSEYIGDGDTKTFKALLDVQPYGEECIVKKCECIGHVQKRMGTRLRNVQKKHKLGGRGKGTLTLGVINKLSTYYGLAIRRNVDSVENMKKAIMATYYHICSTEKNPQHEYCPAGEDSWCFYQKAKAADPEVKNVPHPDAVNADVAKHILPIYEELSRDELLERCLGGHTQNANESFNSTLWRLNPKHLHSGFRIVEISAYIAAGMFNEGFTFLLHLMNDLEMEISTALYNYAQRADSDRVSREGRRSLASSKEARKARYDFLMQENDKYEEAEGLMYGAGIAD